MTDERAGNEPASSSAESASADTTASGWKMPAPQSGLRRETKIGLLVVLVLVIAFGYVVFQRLQQRSELLVQSGPGDSASSAETTRQHKDGPADKKPGESAADTSLPNQQNDSPAQQPFFIAQNEPRRIDQTASAGGASSSPFPADQSHSHSGNETEPGQFDSHRGKHADQHNPSPRDGNPFAGTVDRGVKQNGNLATQTPQPAEHRFPAEDSRSASAGGTTPAAGNPFARSVSVQAGQTAGNDSQGNSHIHAPQQVPPQTFAGGDPKEPTNVNGSTSRSEQAWDLGGSSSSGRPGAGSGSAGVSPSAGSAAGSVSSPGPVINPFVQTGEKDGGATSRSPSADFHRGGFPGYQPPHGNNEAGRQGGNEVSGSDVRQAEPKGEGTPHQNGPFFVGPSPRRDASGTAGNKAEGSATTSPSADPAAQSGQAPRPLFGPALPVNSAASNHPGTHSLSSSQASQQSPDSQSSKWGGFRVVNRGPEQARSTTAVQTAGTDDDLNFPFGRPQAPATDPAQGGQRPVPGEAPSGGANSSPLPVGDGHQFPGTSPGGSPVSPADHPKVYTVRNGDNYWTISRKAYGSARYFRALDAYNRHRITDPKKMRPGMKVLVPPLEVLRSRFPELCGGGKRTSSVDFVEHKPAGFFRTPDGQPMYRVGKTDTLGEIARRHLGRASRWIQIYQMNRDRITNPNRLKIGTELRLPADASRVQVVRGPRTVR